MMFMLLINFLPEMIKSKIIRKIFVLLDNLIIKVVFLRLIQALMFLLLTEI